MYQDNKHKGQNRFASNKKTQQIADRIQNVIELCVNDRNQGTNGFQQVVKAQRNILDLLVGSELPEVNIPGYTGNGSAYGSYVGGSSGVVNNGFNRGINNIMQETQKGNKPIYDINGQTPRNYQQGYSNIPSQNIRGILGDDAMDMIEQIEKKAFIQIQSLRRQRTELVKRLNQQIGLHNHERRKRSWCEDQIKRMIVFLQQQGIQVGPIQYPPWYFQNETSQANQNINSQFRPQSAEFKQIGQSSNQIPSLHQPHHNTALISQQNPLTLNSHQQSTTQQIPSNGYFTQQNRPQSSSPNQGYGNANDGYGGLRSHLEELRQENRNLRQNLQQIENPNEFSQLQHRLNSAEQRARNYQQEMTRWKLQASRKIDSSGLAQLLEQSEIIRQETIRLLKLKQAGKLSGNTYQDEEQNYQSQNSAYNTRSRKQLPKGSLDTNIISPKSDYQHLLNEMKRITDG